MTEREIVLPYCPRPLFMPYHTRKERFAKIVAHRRFGKTVGCVNDLIKHALHNSRKFPPPRYSYVAPTFSQAKDVAWSYLKHYAESIPKSKISEGELWVEFPNGARIRLYGADNYDRMRGLYNDGIVVDEPAQMDPRAWPEVMRPTLSDYRGWATFIGTPKGRDWFYRVDRDEAGVEVKDDWFRLVLKASETGVIPDHEMVSLRAGLSDDQYLQEFECSFEAAIQGAYYARLIEDARNEGRIGRIAMDPLLPLRAYVDIGGAGANADSFTMWIVQFVGDEIRLLDYYEAQGQTLGFHVQWLRDNKYEKAIIQLPHDGVNTDIVTGKRVQDHLREAGLNVLPPLKNQGKGAASQRIEAARRLFTKMRFNEEGCAAGIEALVHYHEKRDEKRNIGLGPLHNWASHAADAFGMMAMCYQPPSAGAAFNRKLVFKNTKVA